MARANAHYYATRDPFGAKGDFTTAPEISQIFGELIGAWMAGGWQHLGAPHALLCELGPGRGTLMKDVLRATKKVAGFHDAVTIRLVETSPTLIAIQNQALHGCHPRVTWQESLDNLPALPLLLIANEFFDTLPIEQHVMATNGWTERRIDCANETFAFVPEGEEFIREESPASLAYITRIAAHIRRFGGAALVIDYGYHLPAGSGNGPTLQALRAHQETPVLELAGEVDLTAHVDFAGLARAALSTGAFVHGPVEQGLFLKRLGAELRATALCKAASPAQQEAILSGLERIVAPHQMGELFKVMAVTATADTPAGF
jgi:NADH dehydrogenase [ubiquinone] 1 alpha subcomplex assembly factor 7